MSTQYEGEWPPRASGTVGEPWPPTQQDVRQTPYGPGYHGGQPPSAQRTKPKKKKPIFLIFFLVINFIFIIWIITGVAAGTDEAVNETCAGLSGVELTDCESAAGAGAAVGQGLGIAAIVILWCVVDFLLFIPWAIYRISRRSSAA